MANNYTRATVLPFILASACTAQQLEQLEKAGFTYEDAGDGRLYFFSEEGPRDEDYETDESTEWEEVFRAICKKAKLKEILVEGAYTCDKMRPGEFGGFVTRITKTGFQSGGTGAIAAKMRAGKW